MFDIYSEGYIVSKKEQRRVDIDLYKKFISIVRKNITIPEETIEDVKASSIRNNE